LASHKNQLKVFQRNFEILKADKKLCTNTTERQHSNQQQQQQQKIDTLTFGFAYLTSYLIKATNALQELTQREEWVKFRVIRWIKCCLQIPARYADLATCNFTTRKSLRFTKN
jgi:hypothetical protein